MPLGDNSRGDTRGKDGILDLMPTLTKEIIIAAITGFESQKTGIDLQIAQLRAMLNGCA